MSNTYCQKYAAIVNAMRDPMNSSRIMVELNSKRSELHYNLARHYWLDPEETRHITDNLPELPTDELAVWLDNALSQQEKTHDNNVKNNKSLYDMYIGLYHDFAFWPNILPCMVEWHDIGPTDSRKAHIIIQNFLCWLKQQMVRIGMGAPVDTMSPKDKYRAVCCELAKITPKIITRYDYGHLYKDIMKYGVEKLLGENMAWFEYKAMKLGLSPEQLRDFLEHADTASYDVFFDGMTKAVETALLSDAS